ncbi:unnamed protein product [Dibothriocephalus latus]|uniref:Uncharacterized protein n=1 Tax=Dibothriocephalus latus TaxID=60516 RepID=A0A3P7R6R4_DIBLA|nr:unnamed protein product [Dibothriocephalus latus]
MLQLDSVPVGKSHSYVSSSTAVGVVVQLQRRLHKKHSPSGQAGGTKSAPSDRNGALEDSKPGAGAGAATKTAQRPASAYTLAARPSICGSGWTDESAGDNGQQISIHHSGSMSKLSIQLSFHLEVSSCHHYT